MKDQGEEIVHRHKNSIDNQYSFGIREWRSHKNNKKLDCKLSQRCMDLAKELFMEFAKYEKANGGTRMSFQLFQKYLIAVVDQMNWMLASLTV